MCGILVTHSVNRPFSHKSLSSLRKRGPDQIGFLGGQLCPDGSFPPGDHRSGRNAAPSLSRMTGTFWRSNGEIYNFNELRSPPAGQGASRFAATNDAEVLLHGWTAWGPDVLRELTEFWSFVIYDKLERRLTLARDQFRCQAAVLLLRRERAVHRLADPHDPGGCRGALSIWDYSTIFRVRALPAHVRRQDVSSSRSRKVLPGHTVDIDLRNRCCEEHFIRGHPYARERRRPCSNTGMDRRDSAADRRMRFRIDGRRHSLHHVVQRRNRLEPDHPSGQTRDRVPLQFFPTPNAMRPLTPNRSQRGQIPACSS